MVETTNAAQACVELLRRENLGVATFMILVIFFYINQLVCVSKWLFNILNGMNKKLFTFTSGPY